MLSLLLWTPSNPAVSVAATEVKKATAVKTDPDDKIGDPTHGRVDVRGEIVVLMESETTL
jgi:hypothetical protein